MKQDTLQQKDLYNIIMIKNVDTEDFYFRVDNQPYSIGAGQTKNFPKFMATLAVKHLIDKILTKRNKEGNFLANKQMRSELADKIVVGEEDYEVPIVPSDEEIVEEINASDIDSVLERQKNRIKKEVVPEVPFIPPPAPQLTDLGATLAEKPKKRLGRPKGSKSKEIPSRDEIMNFAKNTLKVELNDEKTKEAWEKMSDEELATELGYFD